MKRATAIALVLLVLAAGVLAATPSVDHRIWIRVLVILLIAAAAALIGFWATRTGRRATNRGGEALHDSEDVDLGASKGVRVGLAAHWDEAKKRFVLGDQPEVEEVEEWPFYCATFHLAIRWYGEHPSEELFFFLLAMEPLWPYSSNDPDWPYFSSDPANWPVWLDLAGEVAGKQLPDEPPYDRHYLVATEYVARWGNRDTAQLPGVRALASAMAEHGADAHELRSRWVEVIERCASDPESRGGPYTIDPPP